MKYAKPEVVVLGAAVTAITSSTKRFFNIADNPNPVGQEYHTSTAYEVDE
jgi:hypothetical protein